LDRITGIKYPVNDLRSCLAEITSFRSPKLSDPACTGVVSTSVRFRVTSRMNHPIKLRYYVAVIKQRSGEKNGTSFWLSRGN